MSADGIVECPKCKEKPGYVEDYTLREYYEFYYTDTEFVVSYGAECTVCGYEKDFDHKEGI